mmetsp:Transcript_38833/g.62538  ORF Transcript_38833/g.62538 Transcript_38833/m.62538 type:complete len:1060 (-) Transcript_38833:1564-4743(-)
MDDLFSESAGVVDDSLEDSSGWQQNDFLRGRVTKDGDQSSGGWFASRQAGFEEPDNGGPREEGGAGNGNLSGWLFGDDDRFKNSSPAQGLGTGSNLRNLIQQKEKELHDINDYRIRSLEQSLREKESQLEVQRERFSKLKEDFQYNLKLIEDRDTELTKYDAAFAQVKSVVRDKEGEVSDLKIQVAEVETQLKRATNKSNELEGYYSEKIKDMKATMDSSKWSLEDAMRRDRESFDVQKSELERKLREKDDDLEIQRRELSATYDEISRKKHLEHQRKVEELQAHVRELETKLDARGTEHGDLEDQNKTLRERVSDLEGSVQTLEKKNKSLHWDIEDVRKLKDARIAELEQETTKLSKVKQQILDEYETKMTQLLHTLHNVEKSVVQQKEQYESQLQAATQEKDEESRIKCEGFESRLLVLTQQLRDCETELDAARTESTRGKWELQEQLSEKQKEIDELKQKIQVISSKRESVSSEARHQLADKDMEIKTLREKHTSVRDNLLETQRKLSLAQADAELSHQTISELKSELSKVERVHNEQLEQHETELVGSHNQMVATLQAQRDRLMAENQEYELKIVQLENTVTELNSELAGLKSEVRTMRSLGGTFGSNERKSNEQQQLFEGDLGPPSPIGSWASGSTFAATHQPHPTPPIPPRPPGDAKERETLEEANKVLAFDNQKLSNALHMMRMEMEQLTSELAEHRKEPQVEEQAIAEKTVSTIPGGVDIEKVVQENKLLHQQSINLHNYVSLLQQNASLQMNDSEIARECTILRTLIDTQAKQLELMREDEGKFLHQAVSALPPVTPSPGNQAQLLQAEESRKQLESDLLELRDDLERVMKERDQLAELSNRLGADLKRVSRGSATAEQLKEVEKEVAEQFQTKIKSVEQALEQIVMQNRMLKQQLRSQRVERQHVEDDHGEVVEEGRDDQKRSIGTRLRGVAQQDDFSLNIRQARANREEDRLTRALGVYGHSPAERGSSERTKTARERLVEARKRLELAEKGSKRASIQARTGTESSPRKTVATRKKRLDSGQGSQPSSTTAGRKVRNYNVRDDTLLD